MWSHPIKREELKLTLRMTKVNTMPCMKLMRGTSSIQKLKGIKLVHWHWHSSDSNICLILGIMVGMHGKRLPWYRATITRFCNFQIKSHLKEANSFVLGYGDAACRWPRLAGRGRSVNHHHWACSGGWGYSILQQEWWSKHGTTVCGPKRFGTELA